MTVLESGNSWIGCSNVNELHSTNSIHRIEKYSKRCLWGITHPNPINPICRMCIRTCIVHIHVHYQSMATAEYMIRTLLLIDMGRVWHQNGTCRRVFRSVEKKAVHNFQYSNSSRDKRLVGLLEEPRSVSLCSSWKCRRRWRQELWVWNTVYVASEHVSLEIYWSYGLHLRRPSNHGSMSIYRSKR